MIRPPEKRFIKVETHEPVEDPEKSATELPLDEDSSDSETKENQFNVSEKFHELERFVNDQATIALEKIRAQLHPDDISEVMKLARTIGVGRKKMFQDLIFKRSNFEGGLSASQPSTKTELKDLIKKSYKTFNEAISELGDSHLFGESVEKDEAETRYEDMLAYTRDKAGKVTGIIRDLYKKHLSKMS